ncbi:hypothetical protein [Thermoflavimicrobium dichotomicum]|nr:hypothetical protein [Thermoflavimicrobium dichotomicum]
MIPIKKQQQPRKLLRRLMTGCSIFVLSFLGWIGFIYLQQTTHAEPDQVYIMGTIGSYVFVFIFLLLLLYFIFSFVKLRCQPERLKRRFYIFVAFYLIASPLVLLCFDNYLLVTAKGIHYNPFLTVEGNKIKEWNQIEKLVLDYEIKNIPPKTHEDLRLRYMLYFKDGSTVDLNNVNSPLYKKSEFITIHRVLLKYKVPIQIMRPLPPSFQDKDSFIYQLFHQQYRPDDSRR